MKWDFKSVVDVLMRSYFSQLDRITDELLVTVEFESAGEKTKVVLREGNPDFPKRVLAQARGRNKTNALFAALIDAYVDDVNDIASRMDAVLKTS